MPPLCQLRPTPTEAGNPPFQFGDGDVARRDTKKPISAGNCDKGERSSTPEDWVVETERLELMTHPRSHRTRLRSTPGTGFQTAETEQKKQAISQQRPNTETGKGAINPYFCRATATRANGVRALQTGWWRKKISNWLPTTQSPANPSRPPLLDKAIRFINLISRLFVQFLKPKLSVSILTMLESFIMSEITLIQNADWIIAWDETAKSHGYLRNADVAFKGDTIIHVGNSYSGSPDRVIEGRDLMVIPGLVDIHSHPSLEPSWRGIREEHGVPEMYMTGLYERSVAYGRDEEGERASMEVAYSELLLSGVTSIADLSKAYPGWVDLAAKSGIRGISRAGICVGALDGQRNPPSRLHLG